MPDEPLQKDEQLYLYAIVSGLRGAMLGPIGLDGAGIYAITSGRVTAIVSPVSGPLRPERRHLAGHQEVLKRLMAESDAVLPVAFGTMASGTTDVRQILAGNEKVVLRALARLTCRVEMGLRVAWDVPNIFEYIVATRPELRAARDQFFCGGRTPSQDEKIELGQMFEQLVAEERERDAGRIEESLASCCVEIKRLKPRHEREVVNLACLVDRERQEEFGRAVFSAAHGFDSRYAFDFNGPWAAHNFVDIALDLGSVRRARARA